MRETKAKKKGKKNVVVSKCRHIKNFFENIYSGP